MPLSAEPTSILQLSKASVPAAPPRLVLNCEHMRLVLSLSTGLRRACSALTTAQSCAAAPPPHTHTHAARMHVLIIRVTSSVLSFDTHYTIPARNAAYAQVQLRRGWGVLSPLPPAAPPLLPPPLLPPLPPMLPLPPPAVPPACADGITAKRTRQYSAQRVHRVTELSTRT